MRITPPTSGVFLALPLLLWLSPSVFGAAVPRFAFVASAKDNTVSICSICSICRPVDISSIQ
jgi:hypothetical protein